MLTRLAQVARFISKHPLTCDHQAAALVRFAEFQLKSRIKKELVVPWIEGTRLAVSRGMTGATGNIYAGLQDFPDMAFLLHFLRAGDLICDVGANVGSYTVLASGVCGARTFAFEPDPDALAALRRNVEINQLGDLVTVHEIGLAAFEGVTRFTVGLGTENRITHENTERTRQIPVSTLDRISGDEAPILLKIDVEGSNREVVEGAAGILESRKLKAIIIEWPSHVYDELIACNFEMVAYDAFQRKLKGLSGGQPQANYLFVRDRDFVIDRVASAQAFHVFGQKV